MTERLGDVRERVRAAGGDAVVVVDDNQMVLGLLRTTELEKDPSLSMEDAMRPGPSTFRPHVPIKEMADYMTKHELESAPITTSDGVLVGLLYRTDALREAEGCPECVRAMI
ncbi:MAG TPA: CBS domain-containing protein [Candidatus Limnocylindrales bacterium]|nr:CBS domain-containing protein [Candidatus Limnocylindrales bacterium]